MPKSKIIYINPSKQGVTKLKKSSDDKYEGAPYKEEEWATVEEIEQLDEEKIQLPRIMSLPSGSRPIASLDEVEAELVRKTVESVDGNAAQAAKILQVGRATLYRKLYKHGLSIKKIRANKLLELKNKKNEKYQPLKIVKKVA